MGTGVLKMKQPTCLSLENFLTMTNVTFDLDPGSNGSRDMNVYLVNYFQETESDILD